MCSKLWCTVVYGKSNNPTCTWWRFIYWRRLFSIQYVCIMISQMSECYSEYLAVRLVSQLHQNVYGWMTVCLQEVILLNLWLQLSLECSFNGMVARYGCKGEWGGTAGNWCNLLKWKSSILTTYVICKENWEIFPDCEIAQDDIWYSMLMFYECDTFGCSLYC